MEGERLDNPLPVVKCSLGVDETLKQKKTKKACKDIRGGVCFG
jgi:hypothetical protein